MTNENCLLLNDTKCNYCFCENNEKDMICVCKCCEGLNLIHKDCFIKWFNLKHKEIVIPGRFDQFNLSCSKCKNPYIFKYTEHEIDKKALFIELTIYLSIITSILFSLYLLCGYILVTSNILLYDIDNYLNNILLNGFIITHLIILFFYIIYGFVLCLNDGCICCFFMESSDTSRIDSVDNPLILIIILIILSVIISIMIMYCDISSRILQKHRNLKKRNISF